MTVTLRELMDTEVLAGCRVLGGAAGLDGPVSGITVLESPAALEGLEAGHLALSSGRILGEGYSLSRVIERLARPPAAGLLLRKSRRLPSIPHGDILLADRVGLPLILVPARINPGALTGGVATYVSQHQTAALRLSALVLEQGVEAVLSGSGLQELVDLLARWTNQYVTLEGPGRYICSGGPLPSGWEDASFPRLDAGAARALGFYNSPRPRDEQVSGRHVRRLVMPLKARVQEAGRVVGFLCLWEVRPPLGWRDEVALRQFGRAVTLQLLHEVAVQEVQNEYRLEFIDSLFSGTDGGERLFTAQGRPLRWQFLDRHFVIVIAGPPGAGERMGEQQARLLEAAEGPFRGTETIGIAAVNRRGEVVVLVSFTRSVPWTQMKERCHALHEEVKPFLGKTGPFFVGVGRPRERISDLLTGYQEAQEAIRIGRRVLSPRGPFFFDQLGMYKVLSDIAHREEAYSYLRDIVEPVLAYDRENNADLFRTLQVFLECDGNVRQGAEALFVHPNTLQYRLTRIKELTGLDWKRTEDLFALLMGVALYRLTKGG